MADEIESELERVLSRLPAKELISVSDIAAALDIHVSGVYGLLEEGKLTSINVGVKKRHHYKITRTSIVKFIERRITR